jgi:hypothetical protein
MPDASSLFSSPDLSWHPCRLSLLPSLLVLGQLSPQPLLVPQAELLQVLQEARQEARQEEALQVAVRAVEQVVEVEEVAPSSQWLIRCR